jgi:CheY-like chemotaxis protein
MQPKLLIVDDVNFFIELEKSYLSTVDCEIYTASNGKEALDVLQKIVPDLVIIDYEMPVMNGIEFLKSIRINQVFKHIPVILVSAFIDNELEEMVKSAGANKILKKPFTQEDLLSAIDAFLKIEKRKKERIKVSIPAFYGFEDKMDKGLILDLSEGGAFLAGDINLREGAVLELKFLLPDTNRLFKTWAKIIWINEDKNKKKPQYPNGAGLEFLGLSKESINILRKFIEEACNES